MPTETNIRQNKDLKQWSFFFLLFLFFPAYYEVEKK